MRITQYKGKSVRMVVKPNIDIDRSGELIEGLFYSLQFAFDDELPSGASDSDILGSVSKHSFRGFGGIAG